MKKVKKIISHIQIYGFKAAFLKSKEKLKLFIVSLLHLNRENILVGQNAIDTYLDDLFKRSKDKSLEYVAESQLNYVFNNDIRLIAFYMPMCFPANNTSYEGNTAWINIATAMPQFVGHYQPHLPDELGFYDLRIKEIFLRQIDLAKKYGIYGFCFYKYSFDKEKVETPLNYLLENTEINFPFCLILQYTSAISNIEEIKKILIDPRYIKVNKKPMIMISNIEVTPNTKDIICGLREKCEKNGIGEIYLVGIEKEGYEPENFNLDAFVEMPPLNMQDAVIATSNVTLINTKFSAKILSYSDFVNTKNYLKEVPYKLFKTVCTNWDDTVKSQPSATVFINSNPTIYQEWLSDIIKYTNLTFENEERIVFLKAWNEWENGAHLEPDRKYGYAYLQATAEALIRNNIDKQILYVCHDAHFHGAQILSLNIIKFLKKYFSYSVHVILLSGGILENEFLKYSTVYNLEKNYNTPQKMSNLLAHLKKIGLSSAICSTVISGDLVKLLAERNFRTLTLIHELPGVIKQYNAEEKATSIVKYSDRIVFPSLFVKEKFIEIVEVANKKCVVSPQGLFNKNKYKSTHRNKARTELRIKLGLPEQSKIVLAVAYGDYRKGLDLFVDVALNVLNSNQNVFFVWVGNKEEELFSKVWPKVKFKQNIIFIPAQYDIALFYAGADLYLLTSREDPFPSVVLEAMNVGVPIVGFDGAGGFKDIITEKTGILVPYLNTKEMSKAVLHLLNNEDLRLKLGENSSHLVDLKFQFSDYVYSLLNLLDHNFFKVSVIVPNYNYAHYLKERIKSILDQSYPIYEILILDDDSTDNSIELIETIIKNEDGDNIKLIINETNSGCVFRQWEKGLELAKGDFIWIAEADDMCYKNFLEGVMQGFFNKDVVLSYCQSKQINETGEIIAEHYLNYTDDIDTYKWKSNYQRDGIDEITDTLAIKNTIPNISAVVFKKLNMNNLINEIINFKVAGDWFFYISILQRGKINFISKALNLHRRHEKSVTKSLDAKRHLSEIVEIQDYVYHKFGVNRDVREKALKYREKVAKILLK